MPSDLWFWLESQKAHVLLPTPASLTENLAVLSDPAEAEVESSRITKLRFSIGFVQPFKFALRPLQRARMGTVPSRERFSVGMEMRMGLAEYKVVPKGNGWSVLHDGAASNEYASKEAAFESAVAAASLALREGHEVHVSVPGRQAGNRTACWSIGVKVRAVVA